MGAVRTPGQEGKGRGTLNVPRPMSFPEKKTTRCDIKAKEESGEAAYRAEGT